MNGQRQARWIVSGIVEAPVEAVADVLCAIQAGPVNDHNGIVLATEGLAAFGEIVLSGGPRQFTATVGTPPVTSVEVDVDREHRRVAVQGHFWYRGIYTVEPHERGSRIVYRAENIARGVVGRLVPLWQRRFDRDMRERLARLLQAMGTILGCAAYPTAA
ncbi:SRPBCC family protein [Sphaerobacter sp.]|uniref:SRPBCC family protein n=1 Tax=Sphaerobacter sp. TaxID=2099654 RepID=UPI001D95A3F3|nr:SRPBCC family protein [Sphaerobacter sp.]MBX5445176.1 SRPBCC family protein [Sphaerobacter sp.]